MILTRNMFIYFRFSGSGLKRGLKNNIFWSEMGQGFENRAAHPYPLLKFLTSEEKKERQREPGLFDTGSNVKLYQVATNAKSCLPTW